MIKKKILCDPWANQLWVSSKILLTKPGTDVNYEASKPSSLYQRSKLLQCDNDRWMFSGCHCPQWNRENYAFQSSYDSAFRLKDKHLFLNSHWCIFAEWIHMFLFIVLLNWCLHSVWTNLKGIVHWKKFPLYLLTTLPMEGWVKCLSTKTVEAFQG